MIPFLSNRVKAFSLLEMLIVMILSSMVVAAIYFAYRYSSMYYLSLSRRQEAGLAITNLYFQLKKEMEESDQVQLVEPGTISFHFNDKRGIISYSFFMDSIIRKQEGRSDLFLGKFEKIKATFLKKESQRGRALDRLQLDVLLSDSIVRTFDWKKEYDAATLLQIEGDTIQ